MSKELQKQRIRTYFIEAAKKIALEQGGSAVTIRNSAELAGYSYATIYNYFSDLNDLLWNVSLSCMSDIVKELTPKLQAEHFDLSDVKRIYREYAGVFVHNPKLFELLFFNFVTPPQEDSRADKGEAGLAQLILTKFRGGGGRKIPGSRIPDLSQILTSSVHGHLALYFSGKTTQNPDDLYSRIEITLKYILEFSPAGEASK